jgi:hypothetical protein
MKFNDEEARSIHAKMARCDLAIGKVRENRLNRKDADELVRAVMSLTNEIRVIDNFHRLVEEGLV